ncbi:hypothetical protein FZW96_21600 [Bacillus sp. BGMRC 2118]|nr:hypothetical protein FZW96_21600 [Bacillus sp. BGMRC 2118]
MQIKDTKIKINEIQNLINSMNINDFYIYNYEFNGDLTIAGSFDFSYYHDLEIHLNEVSFITCPGSIFNMDTIRLATEDESKRIFEISHGYNEGFNICLEDSDFNIRFYISAMSFDYSIQKVYYYKRDNLKANEKVADWVK